MALLPAVALALLVVLVPGLITACVRWWYEKGRFRNG